MNWFTILNIKKSTVESARKINSQQEAEASKRLSHTRHYKVVRRIEA